MRRVLVAIALLLAWAASAWALTVEAPDSAGVGQPFVVRIVSARPLEQARLAWRGRETPLDVRREGREYAALAVLGADAKDAAAGAVEPLAVHAVEGGQAVVAERRVRLTVKDYPEQRLQVAQSMATPPKELAERLKAESRRAREAATAVSPARRWELPLACPLAITPDSCVTSVYGLRRFFNDQPKDPHRGVDFKAALGTPVRAVAAGTVVLAADFYYAGQCVYVDHGQGLVSASLHLSERKVREGDRVAAGQVIGLSGKSGRVTGPHLHFSLFSLGQSLDPLPLFAEKLPERKP